MRKVGRPKGTKLSQETKNRISESKIGYVHDEKTKECIRESIIKYYDNVGRKTAIEMCICPSCGTIFFKPGNIQQTHCSIPCSKKGENSPFYRDGSAKEYRRVQDAITKRNKFKLWRFQVLFRDNFTCRFCSATGDSAHHLVDMVQLYHNHPDLLYEPDIGLTLCKTCHAKLHHYIRKGCDDHD